MTVGIGGMDKEYNFGNFRKDNDPAREAKSQAEILLRGFDRKSIRGFVPRESVKLLAYAVEREQKEFITYRIMHTPSLEGGGASFFPFDSPEYKGIDEEDAEMEGGSCGSPSKERRPVGGFAGLTGYQTVGNRKDSMGSGRRNKLKKKTTDSAPGTPRKITQPNKNSIGRDLMDQAKPGLGLSQFAKSKILIPISGSKRSVSALKIHSGEPTTKNDVKRKLPYIPKNPKTPKNQNKTPQVSDARPLKIPQTPRLIKIPTPKTIKQVDSPYLDLLDDPSLHDFDIEAKKHLMFENKSQASDPDIKGDDENLYEYDPDFFNRVWDSHELIHFLTKGERFYIDRKDYMDYMQSKVKPNTLTPPGWSQRHLKRKLRRVSQGPGVDSMEYIEIIKLVELRQEIETLALKIPNFQCLFEKCQEKKFVYMDSQKLRAIILSAIDLISEDPNYLTDYIYKSF